MSSEAEAAASGPAFPRPAWRRALLVILGGLAALFFWWAWKSGAYFGTVFYPGAIGVFALVILLLVSVGRPVSLDPRLLAVPGALALIAGWTLLSLLWTPTGGAAIEYADHAFSYAALALAGTLIGRLLGEKRALAQLPVAVGAVGVGMAIVITIATHDYVAPYLFEDGTLQFPFGYRNAEAAFLLISLWPVLSLAADRERHWAVRAPMVGGAVVLAELAMLAQSRGSVPSVIFGALVWVAFSPQRLRAVLCLALVAVPVAIAAPTLLEVFKYGGVDAHAATLLHHSMLAIILTALLGAAVAAVVFGRLESAVRVPSGVQRGLAIGLVLFTVAIVAGGLAVVFERSGGPVEFVNQRVHEFDRGGIPNLGAKETRFGLNVGSNRHDFWRVSLEQFGEDPILGKGAGSFQIDYLKERESPESPRDPHSVEALFLGELGLPGFLLWCAFLVGTVLAALRCRRLGSSTAWVGAAAAGALGYWLLHASYDWLWNYPAVTAPVVFLAGVAVVPRGAAVGGRAARGAIVGLLAVVLILTVPLFLSERYRERALGAWRADPAAAYTDLERAAKLNPVDAEAMIIEGQIAAERGEEARALAAFHRAEGREPEYFVPYFLSAKILAAKHLAAARAQLARAHELNPAGPQIRRLDSELGGNRKEKPGQSS